jgi:hypothetical protein
MRAEGLKASTLLLPLCSLGAERVGVRWGILEPGPLTHLTLTLSPLKGGEGKDWRERIYP